MTDMDPDIRITKRTVERDVTVNETEIEAESADLGFDISEFTEELDVSMNEAVQSMDLGDDGDGGDGVDVGVSDVADGESSGSSQEAVAESTSAVDESDPTETAPDAGDEEDDEPDEDEPEEEDDADDETEAAEDDGSEEEAPEADISPEEAAEMWDTSGYNDFISGCASGDSPGPQLDISACADLWNSITEMGLDADDDEDGDSESGGDTESDQAALEELSADVDAEDVENAYLLIEGGTDAAEAAKDQFRAYIESGVLEIADYYNSPAANDIRKSVEGSVDVPSLVFDLGGGEYHVV